MKEFLPRFLTLIATLSVTAAGSPVTIRWGGSPSPNMVSPARRLPADPGATTPAWEVALGTHQYSIPTVDRGWIYIGGNDLAVERPGYKPTGGGLLMCVDQKTGTLNWQIMSPRNFEGVKPPHHFDQWKCGVCSGPVVDGDRVFVVGNRGEILCLDRQGQADGNDGPFMDELAYMGITDPDHALLQPTDGDILWTFNLIRELDINGHDVCGSTLLLVGNLLYACTSNGIDDKHRDIPRPDAPTLIVLDKSTGRLVARDDERIGRRLLHCNWSSPCAGMVDGRPLIFFGAGDGFLYAFETPDPDPAVRAQLLRKVWERDCNPHDYRTRDGQTLPYSSHAKRLPDGPSEIIGNAVFHEGRIYVAIGQSPLHGPGQGCLSCLDAATGEPVWSSRLVDRTLATPAISDGLLYLPDYSGSLHCFDIATGERCWVHSLEAPTWGASAFVADGKVYAGTEANILWVLKAGRTREVLSRSRLRSVPITPAAIDGLLFLPTQNALTAIPGGS